MAVYRSQVNICMAVDPLLLNRMKLIVMMIHAEQISLCVLFAVKQHCFYPVQQT